VNSSIGQGSNKAHSFVVSLVRAISCCGKNRNILIKAHFTAPEEADLTTPMITEKK
jgi:hypothetical protein